jgi:hypothetical protein
MKSIKQIRQRYDVITESKEREADKLNALVRAGLFEENKLTIVKRALDKDPSNMTIAERKVTMSLLESLMTNFLSQNYEQLNEKADSLTKFDPRFKAGYPQDKDMPVVLILKRKAIRVYPDNQKVALYYSQALDKYVSIPFGSNMGSLNEDKRERIDNPYVIKRTTTSKTERFLSPKHEKSFTDVSTTIKNYEDNLAAGKYDNDPAAKSTVQRNLITAKKRLDAINSRKKITVKAKTRNVNLANIQPKQMTKKEYKTFQGALSSDPSLNVAHKAAAKFGAFLGRTLGPTGSTRQKLLGSPTVTGAIGKGIAKGAGAVKKVFKEEDSAKYRFKQKLNERRHLQKEDALETAKDILIPGRTAYKEYEKGNYGQAAIEAGIDAASIAAGALTGGLGYAAIKGIKAARAARKASTATKGTTAGTAATGASSTGTATNTAAGAAGAATARTAAKTATKTGRKGAGRNRLMRRGATGAGLGAGLAAAAGGGGRDTEIGSGPNNYQFSLKAQTSRPQFQRTSSVENPLYNVRTTSAWNQAQQTVREEQAFDVVRIIQEQNLKEAAISINGNTMMINSLMADKINTLYESLNEENKEKMVSILNESTDSFKKILDFAVR